MDNKSQDNQVIAHCFITQVLHTKCPAVVSYAERWHPTVTKSSSARKLLDSTKPVRMLSFVNRKAGFQETSWLILQERAELKIQTKKAICTHRKVWSQVATKELRQSCPYFQGSLSTAPVKHRNELEWKKPQNLKRQHHFVSQNSCPSFLQLTWRSDTSPGGLLLCLPHLIPSTSIC